MSAVASAADVAGVRLDDTMRLGTAELVLNGAGVNRRLFLKIYVAGLYLTETKRSAAGVFALSGPKRVSITLLRDLPAQRLLAALREDVRNNSTPGEWQALKERFGRLEGSLLAVRRGRRGDVITFDWLPDAGTLVALNGEVRGGALQGADFYRALLKVWLGERPTSAGLKRALLHRRGE
jgi:hypothetical protein